MQDYIHRIPYKEKLKRRREELQAIKGATPEPPSLHEQIETWLAGLSPEDQNRSWKMGELKAIFNSTPQQIAKVLWTLGWSRRRVWRDNAPTCRFWGPPGQKEVVK